MKKLFSLLIALALVMGVSVVTAMPVAAQPPEEVLDHFKCYRVEEETAPYIGEIVYLEDQFGDFEARVQWAVLFCNPVEKFYGEWTEVVDPDQHLTLYDLYYKMESQELFVPVENQFGFQELVLSTRPVLLGVPTWKLEPGEHGEPVGLDHFLVYPVIEGPYFEVPAALFDSNFELDEDVWVLQPYFFANPVDKDGGGIVNPEAHLVFYEIVSTPGFWTVNVSNQFDLYPDGEPQYLELKVDDTYMAFLAVPSVIVDLPNTVESSTMIFEGELTPADGGVYTGTIPMVNEETKDLGDGIAGFDVYAKDGATAFVEGMEPDTWTIANHDAYGAPGPWGAWYDPDCADWDQYSLELTADHWYLRYTATGESPMSGVMYWYGDGTGYAAETDPGTVKVDHGGTTTDPTEYTDGSAQEWGWHCGWGQERIPLELPGFAVEVTPGGSYVVTLTPAAGPVTNLNTDVTYGTIQLAVDAASSGHTIQVAAGAYGPFKVVGKTGLTIQSSSVVTVQGLQVVTTNYGDRDAVVFVSDSTNIVLDGLTIGPNTGKTQAKDYGVIYENSSGQIKDCTISPQTSGDLQSIAIGIWDGSDITIDPCTIEDFGRIGVFIYNGCTVDILGGSIEGQVYSGVGEVCYGVEVEGAYMDATPGTGSDVTIDGVEIYNCDNTAGPTWVSGGVLINGWLEYFDADDSTVTVRNCDIHDNEIGIIATKSPSSSAHYNNIYDNRDYGVYSAAAHDTSTAVFDARYNWWGDGSGPSGVGPGSGDAVSANVDYDPWVGSVSTTTGTGKASFTPSAGSINVTAVPTPPGCPVVLPHGMFSFNITGLTPGQNVTVTIKLPAPVPIGSVWWKYQGGSWYWLPIGDDDGDDTITITLTDGGQGDADLTVNGQIIDPGGPGLLARGLIVRSTEGGRVTKPGEGHHVYDHGTVVKLVATPDDGYKFVEWTKDVRRIDDVNAAETTITMDWSYVIIANFVTVETTTVETEVQYELNVSSTMGGSVTSPGEGTFPYIKGTVVSLVANPDAGYKFVNWTGDGIANADSTTVIVTMNGDHAVTANFEFEQTTDTDSGGESSVPVGACFIATAAYGTPTAEQIDVLREFRDVVLLENSVGSEFVALYYKLSPPIADFIAGNSLLRAVVRELVVDPVVWIVEATGDIWRD